MGGTKQVIFAAQAHRMATTQIFFMGAQLRPQHEDAGVATPDLAVVASFFSVRGRR
jgi:hypothetical protein